MTIQNLKSQNLILFEVISGSKSFGLNTPTSDTDIKGVYYLPKEQFYGLEYIPQISNETNDEVYYEIGRFVELLLKNNPNILEILATPVDCVLYKHPLMEQLRIEDFLSKLCKETFAGYAMTQIKKARGLKKKILNPMPKERKSLLDFCYVLPLGTSRDLPINANVEGDLSIETSRDLSVRNPVLFRKWIDEHQFDQSDFGLVKVNHIKDLYLLFHDTTKTLGYKGIIKMLVRTSRDLSVSNEVSLSSVPNEAKEIGYLSCNLDGYSAYCKEYAEYWEWMEKRNEERYKTNQQHGKNYDSKNMMHTIRLLQTAEQILATGTLDIKVTNREELLAIKAGEMNYDDVLQKAENLMASIEKLSQTTSLPSHPKEEKAIKTLITIRETLYQ